MEDYSHLDSPRDPPPSYHARWDDSSPPEVKNEDIKEPEANVWMQRIQLVRTRTMPLVEKVPPYFKNDVLPMVKKIRITKRQSFAFFLLGTFAIMPCVIFFNVTAGKAPFGDKILDCGQLGFVNGNATVKGIEGLFIIDTAYGNMSFSLVKFIDVVWDLCVGRGVQFIAWYVSYKVFTDALLRVIERHPTPYRTFAHLCLEGASLSSMGSLVRDMKRYRSRRSKWLFGFIIIATFYLLSIPTVLSAMSGYVSTSEAFVTLTDDDSSEIVSIDNFISGVQVLDGEKIGQRNGSCLSYDLFDTYTDLKSARDMTCDCKLLNGTIIDPQKSYSYPSYYEYTDCNYNYTNNTQTFPYPYYGHSYGYNQEPYNSNSQNYSCNTLFNVTINGHVYKFDSLNLTQGVYCYNGSTYDYEFLDLNSQCMPNTNQNTYKWGFSTMLSAVFVIAQLIWGLAMYAVWQDAQWNSTLVRSGYSMTQLRAAFSLSEAAQHRMGMENEDLMRMESKSLEGNLYGRKTLVDYGMWERRKLPFANEDEASTSRS